MAVQEGRLTAGPGRAGRTDRRHKPSHLAVSHAWLALIRLCLAALNGRLSSGRRYRRHRAATATSGAASATCRCQRPTTPNPSPTPGDGLLPATWPVLRLIKSQGIAGRVIRVLLLGSARLWGLSSWVNGCMVITNPVTPSSAFATVILGKD